MSVTLDNAAVERMRAAIMSAMNFLEEEADNRAAAGADQSDYAREPGELYTLLDGCLELIPDSCPECGACPGFIGAECTGDCGWEQ